MTSSLDSTNDETFIQINGLYVVIVTGFFSGESHDKHVPPSNNRIYELPVFTHDS